MIYVVIGRVDKSKQVAKIGYSKHPEKRIKEIQGMCPLKLELICTFKGNYETESALHYYFRDKKLPYTKEWFKVEGELKNIIQHYRGNNSNPKSVQDFLIKGVGGKKKARDKLRSLQTNL